MKTLIIYDAEGYVIGNVKGSYRTPVGLPYLEVVIPEGKRIVNGIGVNISKNPHQAILEDIPPNEIAELNTRLASQEQAIAELTMLLTSF